MPAYRLNEADLEIPVGWKDNTIHAFVLPGEEGGGAASFVIVRDYDSGDTDLGAYADQQLVKAAQQLPNYELQRRREISLDAKPAIQSEYTWLTPEGVAVQQCQLCVRHDDFFLVFTLTARASTFNNYQPVWSKVLDSVRLRPSISE